MDGHARIAGIVAAALVLGLSCVFAVGCGGAKNMSSSHAASSTGSAGGVSRARALAFAHAVNLRPADVPGTSAIAPEAETAVKPLGLQAARCEGGVSPHRRLVDVKSARFRVAAGTERAAVRSSVEVLPTAALAARKAAAELSRRGRGCTTGVLRQSLEREAVAPARGTAIERFSIAWLAAPLPTAHTSYAVRLALTVVARVRARPRPEAATVALETPAPTARRVRVRVYVDTLGFYLGPAQVSLTASRVAKPPSAALEHRLLSVLFTRAQAHQP